MARKHRIFISHTVNTARFAQPSETPAKTMPARSGRIPAEMPILFEKTFVISPRQYLALKDRYPDLIVATDLVPPSLGQRGFGEIQVTLRRSVNPDEFAKLIAYE
jgi:hypothetical protein